jgi:hypothetical protein
MSDDERKNPELHQLLAAHADVKEKSGTILAEAQHLFKRDAGHFKEETKSLSMFDDKRASEEADGFVYQAMTTTVDDKLKYVQEQDSNWIDLFLSIEATNQVATADVEIDGEILFEEVPATGLLQLSKHLDRVRKVLLEIPTLPPGHEWSRRHDGTYEDANPIQKSKTEKTWSVITLAEASDKHKAQAEKVAIDKPVGTYTTRTRLGVMSSHDKAKMLDRLDILSVAVKKAQRKANCVETTKYEVGSSVWDYILRG